MIKIQDKKETFKGSAKMKETKEIKLSSLTEEVIKHLKKNSNQKLILTLDNTTEIKKEALKKLDNYDLIRIVGGLDFKKKHKYYEETFYIRTLYTPKQLIKIIECFEDLEQQINPFWNDLEKAMFVYRYFAENMKCIPQNEKAPTYDHLKGIVSKKASGDGLASLMKEAMDRLKIPCYYMSYNKNAWNVLKLGRDYYPIDLKKECLLTEEKNKHCKFQFFGRDPGFFQRKDHKIDEYEPYFFSSILKETELMTALGHILEPNVENIKLKKYEKEDQTVFWLNEGCQCDALFDRYLYCEEDNIILVLYCDHQFDILSYLKAHPFKELVEKDYYIGEDSHKREDIKRTYQQKNFFFDYGHAITLIQNPNEKKEGLYSYYHLRAVDKKEQKSIEISKIYSEDYLLSVPFKEIENYTEKLLAENYVKDRIKNNKGYLGYLSKKEKNIIYKKENEKWFLKNHEQ